MKPRRVFDKMKLWWVFDKWNRKKFSTDETSKGLRQIKSKKVCEDFKFEEFCFFRFAFEILIRFLTSPDRLEYFCIPVNMIDIVATFSFFIDIVLKYTTTEADLEFFGIIRIMRLFKLTQHSSGLKILIHTFRASAKELMLLGF